MDNSSSDPPKKSDQKSKKTIYYDGSCPMCTAFRSGTEKQLNPDDITYVDINSAILPESLDKKEVFEEMHVIDEQGRIVKGAESIFSIIENIYWLKPVAWFGRLPGVQAIANQVYKLIGSQRHFIFGSASRLWWVKNVTLLGLLAGLIMSWPLWTRSVLFPVIPWFEGWQFSDSLNLMLLFLLLVTATLSLFKPKPQKFLVITGVVLLLLVSVDQMRFQPWVYQYGFMILLFSTFSWNWRDQFDNERVLNALRIMLAGMYFYAGLQKFNPVFWTQIFPWMGSVFLSENYLTVVAVAGLFIPVVEMAIGVGLLFRPTRRFALFGSLGMLAAVLLAIGPLGHDWNSVVWPWNVAFILFALLLFTRTKNVSGANIFKESGYRGKISIALFFIAPMLFFVNMIDSYPAFALYSGNSAKMTVSVQTIGSLPVAFSQVASESGGLYQFNPTQYSIATVNVPIYPEERVLRQFSNWLCEISIDPGSLEFSITPRFGWLEENDPIMYQCYTEI